MKFRQRIRLTEILLLTTSDFGTEITASFSMKPRFQLNTFTRFKNNTSSTISTAIIAIKWKGAKCAIWLEDRGIDYIIFRHDLTCCLIYYRIIINAR